MKFFWRSRKETGGAGPGPCLHRKRVRYESTLRVSSRIAPGAGFRIAKITFGRRIELAKQIRELGTRLEYLAASKDVQDGIEANILGQEIEKVYIRWGLVEVSGLIIDGEPATLDTLLEKGPESLVREILGAIQSECGLNEAERKN